MKIIFWIKGTRGTACLKQALKSAYAIDMLVLQGQPGSSWDTEIRQIADKFNIAVLEPDDPNDTHVTEILKARTPDLFVLAGYGKILKRQTIEIPEIMTINLHGGRLPEYRGSSPMNWALINGETEFGISIIKVSERIDAGDVLCERCFPIGINDTIRNLHATADDAFPEMVMEVIRQIETNTLAPQKQDDSKSCYYPLRFPDDGLVLWDTLTAKQAHDRIRALTKPYPCAYTYYNGRKVKLIDSALREIDYFGDPGRIYQKKNEHLLVCAADKCLWIKEAIFEDNGTPLHLHANRYDRLTTVKSAVEKLLTTI